MNNNGQVISLMGLGKLGAATLATFASRGWNVIGIDINQRTVDCINEGKSPIDEPDVARLLKEYHNRIVATSNVHMGVLDSSITFIIVPTPSKPDGSFSTQYVKEAIRSIAEVLHYKNTYHLINVTSTVLPGDMYDLMLYTEKVSGKKCGRDFGMVYNPDFIALGQVVKDLLNPDMIIIGQSDDTAGEMIEELHKGLVLNEPKIFRTTFYNAELTKISVNHFLTLKIGYANTIAEICENMPTGDASVVLNAVGSDTRIGKKYMRAGLIPQGPCLPRDSRAFKVTAEKFSIKAHIAEGVDLASKTHKELILSMIMNAISSIEDPKVAILGYSYKEGTPVIEESCSVELTKILTSKLIKVSAYDPAALDNVKKELGLGRDTVSYATSVEECLKDASFCFIATAWPEFGKLTPEVFLEAMREPYILDAWGILPFESVAEGYNIMRIGRNN